MKISDKCLKILQGVGFPSMAREYAIPFNGEPS